MAKRALKPRPRRLQRGGRLAGAATGRFSFSGLGDSDIRAESRHQGVQPELLDGISLLGEDRHHGQELSRVRGLVL